MSSQASDTRTESNDAPAKRLEVLGDECARTILVETHDRPLTAQELTDLTDSSSATVYRRINSLLESDLLAECVRFDPDGSHTAAYEATVDHVTVDVGTDGIDVTTHETEQTPARHETEQTPARIVDRLRRLPIEAVESTVDGKQVEVRMTVDVDGERELSSLCEGLDE